MEQKCESTHAIVLARQRVQMRLQDLFMTLSIGGQNPIYTARFPNETKESLIVEFDNGIDPDPRFCGSVVAKLYVDRQKNFCLALWPNGADAEEGLVWRNEILTPKIKEVSFEFLGKRKKLASQSQNASFAWHPKWEKERAPEIPSQIRLVIEENEGTPIQYAFCLPIYDPIITYTEGVKKL